MSADGIQLQLKGITFKVDLLQIVAGVVEAGAKTWVAFKTGGAFLSASPNLVTGFFSAVKGFKREETIELRAWLLVSGGLLYALEKAINDTNLKEPPPAEAFSELINDLGIRVQTRTYTIEPDFFSSPNKLGLLDDLAHELSAWTGKFGGKDNVKVLLARIQEHFPAGLHRAWMKDSARFEPLETALNSPFADALRAQRERDGYLQYLEEEFTQARLIGQSEDDPKAVTLAQVFVPLRAYVEKQKSGKINLTHPRRASTSKSLIHGEKPRKVAIRLFNSLEEWIKSADPRDAVRLISGGPGIGKSSSMRAHLLL